MPDLSLFSGWKRLHSESEKNHKNFDLLGQDEKYGICESNQTKETLI